MVDRVLRSREAARRLGVKVPTLYAYVSRGLLPSHPAPDGRHSLFLADDVEALARRSRGGRRTETRLATVTTSTTQLGEDGPRYRGRRATELARTHPYEAVAELLWEGTGAAVPWPALDLSPPPSLAAADRLPWAVLMAGAGDPLRGDLRPEAVRAVARGLVATLVAVLPVASRPVAPLVLDGRRIDHSVAAALAARLVPAPGPGATGAVNAALVLLADHELAASTLAVRVAASARADPYDAVAAGMAVMGGPLHGGASALAYALLGEAHDHGPARALGDRLRWGGLVPGFGHTVYRGPDPRFVVLHQVVDDLGSGEWGAVLEAVVTLARERELPPPNVDLGLAALARATGMEAGAGRTIFTVARVAGWVAHYLEELDERPLRYRARAVYAGGG